MKAARLTPKAATGGCFMGENATGVLTFTRSGFDGYFHSGIWYLVVVKVCEKNWSVCCNR